jgi:hypothetical protein
MAGALVVIGALQLTTPRHTNPPVNGGATLGRTVTVPPGLSAVFGRACNDCHSNETKWRWYTYVAPASWLTVRHVNNGRAELNFSEWGSYSMRRRETRLRAICEQSRRGTMPPASYALVHRVARLSPADVQRICDWTEDSRKRLEATPP